MFYVSTQVNKIDNRVFYKCPKCFTQLAYFTIVPNICEACGYLLPNIEKMKKNQQVRYNYHISVKK